MKGKYWYIEADLARELLAQTDTMRAEKRGVDSQVYLLDQYVVLKTQRIKLRNVTIRDDDLIYFDELIHTLMSLWKQGVGVIPILGYCYDEDSKDGTGYIIQLRAKGKELYDDAVMKEFYVWAKKTSDNVYLSSDVDAKEYIVRRTKQIAQVPQSHFDKFIKDMITLIDHDILIDFMGKSNFFYDDTVGFQFIDIDSHTDYKYGLSNNKFDGKLICAYNGFVACHYAVGTGVMEQLALDQNAVSKLNLEELDQLGRNNKVIFEKSKTAMLKNGISEEQLSGALGIIKLYGCRLT